MSKFFSTYLDGSTSEGLTFVKMQSRQLRAIRRYMIYDAIVGDLSFRTAQRGQVRGLFAETDQRVIAHQMTHGEVKVD
jgi:hypothetical protein